MIIASRSHAFDRLAWEPVLRDVAASLPCTRPHVTIPPDQTIAEPEGLAAWFGLLLVRMPGDGHVPDGVPLLCVNVVGTPRLCPGDHDHSENTSRWAVAPALDTAHFGPLAWWLLRAWLRTVWPCMVAATGAALVALIALVVMLDSANTTRAAIAAAVALVSGGGFLAAAAASGSVVARWSTTVEWFSRTVVLFRILRLPVGVSRPATNAVMAGSVLASQLRELSGPFFALLSLMLAAALTMLGVTPLLAPLIVVVPLLCGVVTWWSVRRSMRYAQAAQEAADRGRTVMMHGIAERLERDGARLTDTDMDSIGQDVVSTIQHHRRSRWVASPMIIIASVMPVFTAAGAVAILPDLVAGSLADATAVLAVAVVLGAACGSVMDTVSRAAVSISPVMLARDLVRETPMPSPDVPRIVASGAITLDEVEVDGLGGTSVSLEIAEGETWQLVHHDPAMLTSLAHVLVGIRPAHSGSILDGQHDRVDINQSDLRRGYAFIPHDLTFPDGDLETVLFGGAIDVGQQARQQMLEEMGLAPVVRHLPLGLATPVLDGGQWLDPAVRLRLLLARARVRSPRLTVIDQALDDVDGQARDDLVSLLAAWPGTLVLCSTNSEMMISGARMYRCDARVTATRACVPT